MKIAPHICVALMVLAMMFLLGCTHKELCYDHSHVNEVNVYFNWNAAPDAEPESMGLYIYPQEEQKLLRFSLGGKHGGKIRMKNGTYHVICMNDDTRNITTLNINDLSTFEINTKDLETIAGSVNLSTKAIPKAKGYEEERIVASPEMTWSGFSNDNHISGENTEITLYPECNVISCDLTINNAENLRWVKSVSATISSMAGGYQPQYKSLTNEAVTIAFECSIDVKNNKITGTLSTFGCCPKNEIKHILTVYTIMDDNTKWWYQIDVTDQVHYRDDPYKIVINLDKLPVPAPDIGEGEGGFSADVSEWNEVIYDIKM